MRRLLAGLVVVALMLPAVAVMATEEESYRDDFGSGGYSGNDGSLQWNGSWTESGDSGGSGSGTIHIGPENCSNNKCLHIEGPPLGLVTTSYWAERSADLSVFEWAELSFNIQVIPLGLTTTELQVQVNTGSGWKKLKGYPLSQAVSQTKTLDLGDYLQESFRVRFVVMDVLGGLTNLLYNGYATIDRVEIAGTIADEPATTTSTTSATSTTSTTSGPSTTSTTTRPTTTSTTVASTTTTTTRPGAASTTTGPGEAVVAQPADDVETTTTTTGDDDTSTPVAPAFVNGPPSPPPNSGLHDPGIGLMADYDTGMMGQMDMDQVEVLGAELDVDFSLAVEAFESARVWIAVLALMIAAAIVSGMDTRRARRFDVPGGSVGVAPHKH